MLHTKKKVIRHTNKHRSFYSQSYKVMILKIDKNLNRKNSK